MRKTILISLLLLLITAPAYSATLYMCGTGSTCGTGWSNGSNSNSGASKALPKLTLAGAFAVMSGGDTLIIGNGSYTGDNNRLTNYAAITPPVGSAGAYTVIKAENDGQVTFDGENARYMFYYSPASLTPVYWKFEGIIWARSTESTVFARYASYIKFLRCGAYDTAAGNYTNFTIYQGAYALFEDCYSYGTGRYKFMSYHSDHVIFRRCVGRPDGISAGGQPAAVFSAYASSYVKFQNCIAIDGDQTTYWTNIGDRQGSFFVPCTDGTSQYVDFDQSIGLNVKLGGIQTAHNTDSANVTFTNVAIWDSVDDGTIFNMVRGSTNSVVNCTFGSTGGTTSDMWYWDGATGSITNTLFYNNSFTGSMYSAAPTTQDYNCYYGNTNTTGRTGAHDLTTTNPTTSLLYLPRIESASSLKGAGSSGADIGANVLTLIGTSGTLWGETGYATETGVNMWPFPYEATIKDAMAAYSATGISGARGFATGASKDGSAQTLTKYIWEYIGNQIPSDIYGGVVAATPANTGTSMSGGKF